MQVAHPIVPDPSPPPPPAAALGAFGEAVPARRGLGGETGGGGPHARPNDPRPAPRAGPQTIKAGFLPR